MRRDLSKICSLILLALMTVPCIAAGSDSYVDDVQKWRHDFDADVRTGGWLTLSGRYKIEEGSMTLGSDPSCTVILPARAPPRLGTLYRRRKKFQFNPAPDVALTIDDKAPAGTTELSTVQGKGRVKSGDFSFDVRPIGDDFYLLIQDAHNPAAGRFKGTTWFPIDASYRIAAKLEPNDKPESVAVPVTHIESKEKFTSTGSVVFTFGGRTMRLKSFIDEGQLFVMFLDPTNGKETYGGGRFLYAPLPKDGRTTLDFNKAFNPYCSVNPYVMCPVTPPGNRLDTRMPAGERYTGPPL